MPFSEFVIELRLELELEKDLRMLSKLQLGVASALEVVREDLYEVWLHSLYAIRLPIVSYCSAKSL